MSLVERNAVMLNDHLQTYPGSRYRTLLIAVNAHFVYYYYSTVVYIIMQNSVGAVWLTMFFSFAVSGAKPWYYYLVLLASTH